MSELVEVTLRTLYISGTATLIAGVWGIPLAYLISSRRQLRPLSHAMEALVGVPTVLVGLLLYLLLSRQGPLGFLNMLYTPQAIILGEAVLVTPLLVGVSHRVLSYSVKTYGELALTLGATEFQAMRIAVLQAAPGLIGAMIMAFSRAVGELGVALLVGGNIKGYTRTITTTIALEVSQGELFDAVLLGLVLVAIMISISLMLRILGGVGE